MKQIEIESWALRILENVEKHLPIEDSFVELKATWIDPQKAARRIAAHANAARGEPILWLIGVDEEKGIVGAESLELSKWFASVESCFDHVTPALQSLNLKYQNKPISALCFDSGRAPYVVKNPSFGKDAGASVEWEVPWREGTKTRSARRNDLILLLSPLSKLPKVEILNALAMLTTSTKIQGNAASNAQAIHLELDAYFVLHGEPPFTFPHHKIQAELLAEGSIITGEYSLKMDTPKARKERFSEMNRLIGRRAPTVQNTHVNIETRDEAIQDYRRRNSGARGW